MNKNNPDKNAALITGASAGIGRCYALEIARRSSASLILCARREARLEELKQEIEQRYPGERSVHVVVADLSRFEGRETLLAEIKKRELQVSTLVNNAGFGSLGSFKDTELRWELDMLEVNNAAPLHLSRALLPQMLEAKKGLIINVASTAAFQALPYMSTYGATKSFLMSFSLALAEEVRGSGVLILAHCPGPTDSEFHEVVGLPQKLDFIPSMSTEKVVSQALDSAERGRRIKVNGVGNSAMAALNRVLPKPFAARIVGRILRAYR